MASVPLTEQDVSADWLVLNLQEVRLSDEQFVALCADNRELHLELTAQKELVIMTLPGGKTGRRNDIIELMSPSDRRPRSFRMVQAKMAEYIENGAQFGWLIDPFEKKVYLYRPRKPVECLESPASLYGDPILPGFVFPIREIWQQ